MALVIKKPHANAGDVRNAGLIPGWGRSPGAGHGNPLQYSCLENLMDRGDWWTTVVHGVARLGHNLANKPPPLVPKHNKKGEKKDHIIIVGII